MMVPLAALADAPWHLALPNAIVWAALAGLALLSTALAYIIFFRLLATAGATNTSLVTMLIPVSALLLGILFLGEHLSTGQVGGMVLIAAGLIALDGRALPAVLSSIAGRPPRAPPYRRRGGHRSGQSAAARPVPRATSASKSSTGSGRLK